MCYFFLLPQPYLFCKKVLHFSISWRKLLEKNFLRIDMNMWVEWSHFVLPLYFSFSWRTVGKRKRAMGEREWKFSISLLIWESATARVAFMGSFEGLLTIFLHHFVRTSDAEVKTQIRGCGYMFIWPQIIYRRSIDRFLYQFVSYFHLLHDYWYYWLF